MNNMNQFPFKNAPSIQELNDMIEKTMGSNRNVVNELLRLQAGFENIPDDEKITPDTYGCDTMFIDFFITEDMRRDFNIIARDFLIHEYHNINGYEDIEYIDIDNGEDWPETMFHRFMLNLMVNAVHGGSEYTKALLIYLHKIYYRQEYKSLKRFSKLSASELLSLAKPQGYESFFFQNMARILFIANIKGIKIGQDCFFIYAFFNDYMERRGQQVRYDFDRATGDSYQKCRDKVMERFSLQEMYKYEDKANKLLGNVLKWLGYSPEYADMCDENSRGTEDEWGFALSVLKNTYPNKEFSPETIALCKTIIHVASALTCNNDRLVDTLKDMAFGTEWSIDYEDDPPLFKPEDVMANAPAPEIKPASGTKNTQSVKLQSVQQSTSESRQDPAQDKPEYNESTLLAEMDSLRRKLHKAESEIAGLRTELSEKKKLEEDYKDLNCRFESSSRELAALRNYVYNLENEDQPADDTSVEDMKKAISSFKIIIVGGHTKWVTKMKTEFPGWKFVSATVSGTLDTSVVEKADHVFFFSDTISHSTYYRYLNVLRERKINFGYIHGVNIENNIRHIYNEMKE